MVERSDFGSRSGHSYSSRDGECEVGVAGEEVVIDNFEADQCSMDRRICSGIVRRKFCGPRV